MCEQWRVGVACVWVCLVRGRGMYVCVCVCTMESRRRVFVDVSSAWTGQWNRRGQCVEMSVGRTVE